MDIFIKQKRTQKEFIIYIDEEDILLYNKYIWRVHNSYGDKFYLVRNEYFLEEGKRKNKMIPFHRDLLKVLDKNLQVDHINGNGLDNRKENLRVCLPKDNYKNRIIGKNNTSGYKGVGWDKNKKKWKARIQIDGKYKHLGLFLTKEEAYLCYCKNALIYFGEFTNFRDKEGVRNGI